jgi:hypothetical protein
VDTNQPGNYLFTFSVNDDVPAGFPPPSYLTFMNPPFITNAPSISLRILPNDEDFSQYYIDPNSPEPVGNDRLTFDVLYEKVLRTYYLLYPVMIPIVQLNSEQDVAKNAQAILRVTDPTIWMTDGDMPRTRDMSGTRTTLLQAWCRKVLLPKRNETCPRRSSGVRQLEPTRRWTADIDATPRRPYPAVAPTARSMERTVVRQDRSVL